jgi:hypothetical protein
VAAGSGVAPTHGSAGGGSPELGGLGAPVHQTQRGKRQNGEGTTLNSPRQPVLPGKRWLQRVMMSRLLRARLLSAGCSDAPPALRNHQEDSSWDP